MRHEELNRALLRYNGGELTGEPQLRSQEVALWNPNNLQHRDVDMPAFHECRSVKVSEPELDREFLQNSSPELIGWASKVTKTSTKKQAYD